MLDYYKILDVARTASEEEIRRAYYEKAKRFHPDVCREPEAEHVFQLLNEAYQTLIRPQLRKKYDLKLQYGSLIGYSHVASRPSRPRSAAYEAYVRRRREEIRLENLRNRKYNMILNQVMFWVMALFIAAGIFFGILDAVFSGDIGMLVFTFVFVGVFVISVFYLRKHK